MLDVTGSTDYEYDLAGRLTSVTTEQGSTIRYGYDVYGNITSLTYPDGAVVYYAYDALDRMVSITGRDGNTTYYSYDANGNMTKVTRPNDTFTDIVYDAEGRIVKLSNVKADGKIISDFSYTYDKSGYIIEEIARQDGMVVTTSYTYAANAHPIPGINSVRSPALCFPESLFRKISHTTSTCRKRTKFSVYGMFFSPTLGYINHGYSYSFYIGRQNCCANRRILLKTQPRIASMSNFVT